MNKPLLTFNEKSRESLGFFGFCAETDLKFVYGKRPTPTLRGASEKLLTQRD